MFGYFLTWKQEQIQDPWSVASGISNNTADISERHYVAKNFVARPW